MTPPRLLLRALVAAAAPFVTRANLADPDDVSPVEGLVEYDFDTEFGIYSDDFDRFNRWSPTGNDSFPIADEHFEAAAGR